jgi:hypothetical protein
MNDMQCTPRLIGCALRVAALAALVNGVPGCDGGDGGDGQPDTGYGGGQPVPATINCSDLCARMGDCGGHLCAEDKKNQAYLGLGDAIESECLASCTDTSIQSKATSTQWSCLFEKTCREVFGHDACGMQSTYWCS